MTTIEQLLRHKGSQVLTVSPQETVFKALFLLSEKNIGALPVVDGGKIVGMFSERDYARKVILRGLSSRDAHVGDVMTTEVVTISPERTVHECMERMTERGVRYLPVMDKAGKLHGIVSIGDAVKAVIAEQQELIGHLESYITGYRSG